MPTYEYICNACEHRWEEFQPISAKPTKVCPKCGKKKAERLISSGAGLIFKGSGFYSTDYRSKSYSEAKKRDSGASGSSSDSSSSAPTSSASSSSASSDSAGKKTETVSSSTNSK